MFNININCFLPPLWKIVGVPGKKSLLTGVQTKLINSLKSKQCLNDESPGRFQECRTFGELAYSTRNLLFALQVTPKPRTFWGTRNSWALISFFFFFLIYLFYFWLDWVFITGLCLVVESRAYSLVEVHGLLIVVTSFVAEHRLLGAGVSVLVAPGLQSTGPVAVAHVWDLPNPGIEPVSPALAGSFLSIVPLGSP